MLSFEQEFYMDQSPNGLSPEWNQALSEIAQLMEIPVSEALVVAHKTQELWRFDHLEDAIALTLDGLRFDQEIATHMAYRGIDVPKRPAK